jgi:hypothetical protein
MRSDTPRSFDAPATHDQLHAGADQQRAYLETLARRIEQTTDLKTSTVNVLPSGPVTLHVRNPISDLSENIGCELRDDRWCYVWSWGDPIATTDDLHRVVKAIRHVLAPLM